ncbi:MAG: hypothetical protein J5496_05680 [Lachnospiraceae bacterium]|nr:hypothetical protein [Lachnospiraceae bacterium]
MKRFIKLLILFLLLLCLPFGIFAAATRVGENPYHNSFTASLVDKYERLSTLSGSRLILVGGSSLPFGIDSARLEKALGLPVVNFGVYAALGTKVMTEITLPEIHAGDVVILAPELDPQTYSDYFNPDILWEAACEKPSLLRGLTLTEKEEMAFRWFKFALERKRLEGETVPDGILYARSSFNTYGDIDFPRTENIVAGGYDASQPVRMESLMNESFFRFVQDYIRSAEKKGAHVWFWFSPVNESAVQYSQEEAILFEAFLNDRLPGHVLGRLSDTTYDASYFYNTNYHLTESGAVMHTDGLIRLLREAGTGSKEPDQPPESSSAAATLPDPAESSAYPSESIPAAETTPAESHETTAVPAESTSPSVDPGERFVIIREMGGSLYVDGLTEEGRQQTSLTLPEKYDGRSIAGILEGALASDVLTELTIPENYRFFDSYIFEDTPLLSRIILYLKEPSASSVPMKGLFDGCAKDLAVYIPDESYSAYLSDYNWRLYRGFLHRQSEIAAVP